jgi:hypothetical protein
LITVQLENLDLDGDHNQKLTSQADRDEGVVAEQHTVLLVVSSRDGFALVHKDCCLLNLPLTEVSVDKQVQNQLSPLSLHKNVQNSLDNIGSQEDPSHVDSLFEAELDELLILVRYSKD